MKIQQQLLDWAETPIADLSEYYFFSAPFAFNTNSLPYVINSSGVVEWDVLFQDAKVKDFLKTHNLNDNIISIKTGYPQTGGPGFKEFAEIWQMIYPILDGVVLAAGLGAIIKSGSKWIHSVFKKKEVPPQSYFDLLFSRKQWNLVEFAEALDISREKAKTTLKLFGYEYDPTKMMYVQQKESAILREKLSKINVHDID